MNYSIVFSSKTGNTAKLAETIGGVLPKSECSYFGELNDEALKADMIYIGFWTDKGSCDEDAKKFLKKLNNKNVFLFGTAGFGESQEYYDSILSSALENLQPDNQVTGSFMCQGKMNISVRERYEKLLSENPDNLKYKELIANFDKALAHPDKNDETQLIREVLK